MRRSGRVVAGYSGQGYHAGDTGAGRFRSGLCRVARSGDASDSGRKHRVRWAAKQTTRF